jgi:hypothetical protein
MSEPRMGQPGEKPATSPDSKFTLRMLLCALLLAVFAHGIGTFELRPLDAPGTLRFILAPWFDAFQRHYRDGAELAGKSWCFFALLIPLALALLNYYASRGVFPSRRRAIRVACSRTVLFLGIAICLLVCRYPLLLGGNSNPDESQFAAAATKLFADPVYFRAVDCGSSGPLNIYPLMLPALLGLSPDYSSGRVVALLLIYLSIVVLYRAFSEIGPDDLARVATLPAVAFFSMVTNPDFVHYSSEHVSLLLISLAVFACVRVFRAPDTCALPLAALGALVSAAFFAKMQAVPIVAAAAAVALAYVHFTASAGRVWRPALLLCVGAAPLPVLIVATCAVTGTLPDLWAAYVGGNWSYAQSGGSFFTQLPLLGALIVATNEVKCLIVVFLALLAVSAYRAIRGQQGNQVSLFLKNGMVAAVLVAAATYVGSSGGPVKHPYACSAVLLVTAVSVAVLLVTGLSGERRMEWFGVLACALLTGGLFSVYAPRRGFVHYLLLLVIPLCTAIEWLLVRSAAPEARSDMSGPRAGLSFVILFLALVAGWEYFLLPSVAYNFSHAYPTMAPPESGLIRSLTRQNSGIVVWGWHCETYLGAGRIPATRDTVAGGFVNLSGTALEYFRDRFLHDLRRRPADLFIDALDVSCCNFHDRKTQGFEAVPDVRRYIYSHYIPVADAYNQQFYLRRELAGAEKPSACAAGANVCYESSRSHDRTLGPVRLPDHALLQMDFAPLSGKEPWQTVFAAEAASGDAPLFRFISVGAGRYRFSARQGDLWIDLKDVELADGKRVSLSIELSIQLNGAAVAILCDGRKHDQMTLPRRISGAPVKIMLAPIKDGRSYVGAIDSFQVRDLAGT